MSYNNILIEQDHNITTITINRPSKLNALNRETLSELHNAFVEIEGDGTTRVIILTGSGEKAFVAGADISEFSDFEVKEGTALAKQGQKLVFDFIENLSIPVIAAINGFALGGGLELAMACHFRIASDNAKMGLPETSLGVIPGYGGTQRLPQLVGKGKAMEMIMTARMINADEALKVGLVNYVVTQEELLPLAENLASKIIQNSPLAISSAIKAVNAGFKDGINGYDKEIKQFGKCFGTDDFTEGTTAFLQKRKAEF
ncbi:enoyl-CoA hydratase/isomerase family protein [Aureibaculum sp. A20]|uniref:Enoyl-CoA hydratase/isomerase family protein n=1 Tax=Aureibaculum flavum TaxID=2795986 RepID=A0ABS0WP89_9FLAO|nr:enoyl-CoA hydratase-related protein [Aureibaculum flavum]MBJ2173807.1 enoyl-CoA hydratase/isomerase family protein [Aureibaculum flavum]